VKTGLEDGYSLDVAALIAEFVGGMSAENVNIMNVKP